MSDIDQHPHALLILGLRDRVKHALEHMQIADPGSHSRGYFEGTAQAYAFVAEVLLGGGGPTPAEDVEGKEASPAPTPYIAKALSCGREDGLAYVRDSMAIEGPTPERLAVLRDVLPAASGWDEAAIHALGIDAFGELCGLSTADVRARGDAWQDACDAYNRGGAEGYLAARAEFLGEDK